MSCPFTLLQYIEWPESPGYEQLFNLTNDPEEEIDEIKNPEYQSVLKELKLRHDQLREWVK